MGIGIDMKKDSETVKRLSRWTCIRYVSTQLSSSCFVVFDVNKFFTREVLIRVQIIRLFDKQTYYQPEVILMAVQIPLNAKALPPVQHCLNCPALFRIFHCARKVFDVVIGDNILKRVSPFVMLINQIKSHLERKGNRLA